MVVVPFLDQEEIPVVLLDLLETLVVLLLGNQVVPLLETHQEEIRVVLLVLLESLVELGTLVVLL